MDWCGRDRVPVYQQWNVLFSCSDPLICGLDCWEISVLGSLFVGGGFRAWHLIGWRHDHQPVGGPVAESGLACMDFDTGFLSNLGPVSLTIFARSLSSVEASPCCNSVTGHWIATGFCTCHDSTAVVPCTKFCSIHCIRIEMRAKWGFHPIWVAMGEPFVIRGPGPLVSFQAYLETSLLCIPITTVVFMLSFGYYDYMGWWEGRCGPST